MNIRSVTRYASQKLNGIGSRLFEFVPEVTVNNPDRMNKIGAIISRPDVNRGIMGATAILTQPFIDYYNPNVDDETAKASTCRTVGKILAGTLVGCGVRSLCYYGTKMLTDPSQQAPRWRKLLLPNDTIVRFLTRKNGMWLKNHRNTISLMLGLFAMLFTNVLLDVPLTNSISKRLMRAVGVNQTETDNSTLPEQNNIQSDDRDIKQKFKDIFSSENYLSYGRRYS